jgi:hypothetical protein
MYNAKNNTFIHIRGRQPTVRCSNRHTGVKFLEIIARNKLFRFKYFCACMREHFSISISRRWDTRNLSQWSPDVHGKSKLTPKMPVFALNKICYSGVFSCFWTQHATLRLHFWRLVYPDPSSTMTYRSNVKFDLKRDFVINIWKWPHFSPSEIAISMG